MAAGSKSQADELTHLRDQLGDVREDWLPRIYEARLQRFLHDNDRIWSSASLLVPLSLAPFLALSSVEDLGTAHFVILGAASSVLMALWLVIAESHRVYQDKSLAWLHAIEHHAGVKTSSRPASARKVPSARLARRLLAIAVPALWLAAALWWPR
jgi:hypothetical protein